MYDHLYGAANVQTTVEDGDGSERSITSCGISLRERNEQITRLTGCHNHSKCSNQYLKKESKVWAYRAVLRPILSCCTEKKYSKRRGK